MTGPTTSVLLGSARLALPSQPRLSKVPVLKVCIRTIPSVSTAMLTFSKEGCVLLLDLMMVR